MRLKGALWRYVAGELGHYFFYFLLWLICKFYKICPFYKTTILIWGSILTQILPSKKLEIRETHIVATPKIIKCISMEGYTSPPT